MQDNETLHHLIKRWFPGNFVGKGLMRKAGLNFLPRYVSEFVLSNFLSQNVDEEQGIFEAKKFVNAHYPEPNSSGLIKHKLIEERNIRILSKFKAKINLANEDYFATIPILSDKIRVLPTYTGHYPALLTTGMWGLGTIQYEPEEDAQYSLFLGDFQPFQLGAFDRNEFFEARSNFTLDQWINLLITSLGYRSETLSLKEKMHILSRLIPLIRRNTNMAEFGPKSTGKTYLYRHHSSYTHVISGSSISPAKFVYDLGARAPGLISTADTLVFDEVTGAEFGSKKDFEMVGLLKDYMEGGHVSRGHYEVNEDCSLVFIGNIDIKERKPKFKDYIRELPAAFSDTAFIDRINGFISGWDIPKLSQTETSFTNDFGLMSNYLSEALHNLRAYDNPEMDWARVEKDFLFIRNEKSVRLFTDGLISLLFPGVKPTDDEINFILNFACQLRQNVYDQLTFLDQEEFPNYKIKANYV